MGFFASTDGSGKEKKLKKWKPRDVAQYISEWDQSLQQYQNIFIQKKITGKTLEQNDKLVNLKFLLENCNIRPFGHRVKIKEAIKEARQLQSYVFEDKRFLSSQSIDVDENKHNYGTIYNTKLNQWNVNLVQNWIDTVCPHSPNIKDRFREHAIDGMAMTMFPNTEEGLEVLFRVHFGISDIKVGLLIAETRTLLQHQIYKNSQDNEFQGLK
eukprot:gb/GECH01010376.1/.p1 GENE.gb/GECH01010376.1/~~gb/GECH01010376.1/.p1  ORF type:complete len:212 (+),score=62.83 gb/GECH01010376.1/:1-636(+)